VGPDNSGAVVLYQSSSCRTISWFTYSFYTLLTM
jgi:hypothetical protein